MRRENLMDYRKDYADKTASGRIPPVISDDEREYIVRKWIEDHSWDIWQLDSEKILENLKKKDSSLWMLVYRFLQVEALKAGPDMSGSKVNAYRKNYAKTSGKPIQMEMTDAEKKWILAKWVFDTKWDEMLTKEAISAFVKLFKTDFFLWLALYQPMINQLFRYVLTYDLFS